MGQQHGVYDDQREQHKMRERTDCVHAMSSPSVRFNNDTSKVRLP